MEDLVKEYKKTLTSIRKSMKSCTDLGQYTLLKSCEGSCRYALKKMGRYTGEYEYSPDCRVLLVEPMLINEIAADPQDQYAEIFEMYDEDDEPNVELKPKNLSYREALVMRMCYFDGLSQRETGEKLGITASSVEHYLMRARQKMLGNFSGWIEQMFSADESLDAGLVKKFNRATKWWK